MAHIELTDAEAALLREVLESYVSDIRMEIAGTDKLEYREDLKKKKEAVKGILARLPAAPGR
ncbi:MAG: hypothetical protein Kow0092_37390 [Deferrisomatales bacterium]